MRQKVSLLVTRFLLIKFSLVFTFFYNLNVTVELLDVRPCCVWSWTAYGRWWLRWRGGRPSRLWSLQLQPGWMFFKKNICKYIFFILYSLFFNVALLNNSFLYNSRVWKCNFLINQAWSLTIKSAPVIPQGGQGPKIFDLYVFPVH